MVLFVILAIIVVWCIAGYEGFDSFGNEFVQVPSRVLNWLKNGLNNIDLGYFLPAGKAQHLGPCPDGLNSRDIAGTCWAGKDICDVELPQCTGGCNTWWDGCVSRWPSYLGGGCIGGLKTECTEIKCTSGSITNCPHITKFITDRMTCGDRENVSGLCYDRCRAGYKRAPLAPYLCIPSGL
jgi:hypothetical protein